MLLELGRHKVVVVIQLRKILRRCFRRYSVRLTFAVINNTDYSLDKDGKYEVYVSCTWKNDCTMRELDEADFGRSKNWPILL